MENQHNKLTYSMHERDKKSILIGISEEERTSHELEDNIKMILKDIGSDGVDWIQWYQLRGLGVWAVIFKLIFLVWL